MATIDHSHKLRIHSSKSVSGTVWTVCSDGEDHAVFTGASARSRAIEFALRLAEDLRMHGTVLLLIDAGGEKNENENQNVTRVVRRSRLAS